MRRGVLALTVAVLVVSACGSDDTSEPGASGDVGSSVVVAGAEENAVATGGVCRDWPAGTTVVPCAVDAMGPGGGRVFYDAGSVQPWGRFLEVAPQNWNGTLVKCPGIGGRSCGTTDPDIIPRSTSDGGSDRKGYIVCVDSPRLLPGEAGATGRAIGDGRRNTEVLSQTPECADGSMIAITLAAGYRGGGLADWYLPSVDELAALCRYTGRDAIGGFPADKYVSSTGFFDTYFGVPDFTNFFDADFAADSCSQPSNVKITEVPYTVNGATASYQQRYVRPIRAFA